MKYSLLLILTVLSISCNSQDKGEKLSSELAELNKKETYHNASQIGQYIVEIFEDSKGIIWFGTLSKGIARYDGKTLKYITTEDGLIANAVVSLVEDKEGNLWFGTQSGLSKYDGATFTNYSKEDGLCNDAVANMLIDSKGNFWLGTWGGVCLFDGNGFINFFLPYPLVDVIPNKDTKDWITEIIEDSKGNIWFSRDGYGACKYDGKSFQHYTRKDGLYSNNVQSIVEDNNGNIWFGTRVAEKDHPDPNKRFGQGGLIKYDNKQFVRFPNFAGLSENDVYVIYNDFSGNLWIGTIKDGIYKYDGERFTNYRVSDSNDGPSKAVTNILDDRKGNIWIGCAGGLFRLNSKGMVNITTDGPWE